MTKLKVVLSTLHFPLTMARWFWNALERRDDIDLQVIGPFTGNYIPWNGGLHLDYKYVKKPHIALPHNAMGVDVPTRFIEQQLPWKPDLWLSIDAGWRCVGHPSSGIFVQIQTDPHVLKQQYKTFRSQYDYVFCMQTPYIEDGEIYLPYAYDPTIHYPMDLEKEYDVCLIGLHYEQRSNLVSKLQQQGISVKYDIGIVYDDYRIAYNKARVAISWSSLQDLPARFFEGLAMKLPLISNIVPDIQKLGFVDGEHFLGFSDAVSAIQHIKLLLNDKMLYDKISMNGYKQVMPCTWDARIQSLLKACKI